MPEDALNQNEDQKQSGPNLVLLYVLLALAILAAMGVAALVVRPFHLRHSVSHWDGQAEVQWKKLC